MFSYKEVIIQKISQKFEATKIFLRARTIVCGTACYHVTVQIRSSGKYSLQVINAKNWLQKIELSAIAMNMKSLIGCAYKCLNRQMSTASQQLSMAPINP